ncbi:MAG: dihydrodipicolinate reductase [Pseudomonadota bacterium]
MSQTTIRAVALGALMAAGFAIAPKAATAMEKIDDRAAFMATLGGRSLNIRLYGLELRVLDDGRIIGRAAGRDVSGAWTWEAGYFCRSMMWGAREIPYNCQEVRAEGDRMRFTSDRGTGDTAVFGLR